MLYARTVCAMEETGFGGECQCGSFEFERVIVQRRPNGPITTDFVACASCKAVYFDPLPAIVVTRSEGSTPGGAIGGPDGGRSCSSPPQRHDALMRDVRDAAKDYVKPGRKPSGPR